MRNGSQQSSHNCEPLALNQLRTHGLFLAERSLQVCIKICLLQSDCQLVGNGDHQLHIALGEMTRVNMLNIKHTNHFIFNFNRNSQFRLGFGQKRIVDKENNIINVIGDKWLFGLGDMTNDSSAGRQAIALFEKLIANSSASLADQKIAAFRIHNINLNMVITKVLFKQIDHVAH